VAVADEKNRWLEQLNETDCWRLLADTPVGRIGVLVDSAPEIYPVNYIIDGNTIVFRTDPGPVLAGLAMNPAVCFPGDGLNPAEHTGRSVRVKGRAEQMRGVRDADERERVEQLPIDYWAIGAAPWHRIRIVPTEMTGRRLRRTAPAG
jgi:nitroimidazol reductase NimA-like FMN-containing flavoprotein (pyridoxamine 5'-phosphate oxidase superfamily)